jgi:predicted lipid-binding transport protein (Tim44 family)
MSGDDFQYIPILVFALIAGFLVLRLRSVLGRRTGNERQRRDPLSPPADLSPDKVVPMPARGRPSPAPPSPGAEIAGIAAIKAADRGFDDMGFLAGARGAFEIIVNAFAKGDTASLQPLLSEPVFASFSDAIRARDAAHETHETNLLAVKAIEIADAALEGTTATVTVKFVSDQINVTRGPDGAVIDGNPDQVEEKTDLWSFARSLRARDPNWTLVATHQA